MTVSLLSIYLSIVQLCQKRNKSTLVPLLVHTFVFKSQYRLFSNTYTIMNYAEKNVCCVNQYEIPVALKLPLEAPMRFVFFPIN